MELVTTLVRSEFLPNFLRSQYYQKVVASKCFKRAIIYELYLPQSLANGIPLIKRRSTLQHLEELYKS